MKRASGNGFVVVDTGPLVALMHRDDAWHNTCRRWIEQAARDHLTLVVPTPVLAEVGYLLNEFGGRHHGPLWEAQLLRDLADSPLFALYNPDAADLRRMAALVERYANFPFGLADASVVVAAERLETGTVCTIDRRHFHAVKPDHVDGFELVPEPP